MFDPQNLQKAIREQGLAGWLFYNYHHRDAVCDTLLNIPEDFPNSRPYLAVLPSEGKPWVLVPKLEQDVFSSFPGRLYAYAKRTEFLDALAQLPKGRWAAQCSKNFPALGGLDAGMAAILEQNGISLFSSEALVARVAGQMSDVQFQSHQNAGKHLMDIVFMVKARLETALRAGERVRERTLVDLILAEFENRNLLTDHPPIIGFGAHSALPHYSVVGTGSIIEPEGILQLDLWAKQENGVYADISWVLWTGKRPDPRKQEIFKHLCQTRDLVVSSLQQSLDGKNASSGADLDRIARGHLIALGFEERLCHRTGHSLDTMVHGLGVNLDSVEFPDERPIVEGCCFTVEPGLYFEDWGCRTEINVAVRNGQALVTGPAVQRELLCLD